MVLFLGRGSWPEKVGERCPLCGLWQPSSYVCTGARHNWPLVFCSFPWQQQHRHFCWWQREPRVPVARTRTPAGQPQCTGGGGAMVAWPRHGKAAARSLLLALMALCCLLAQPQPSRAAFFFFGVRVPQRRGGGEEKVPMTVVVPDYSPRPAPLGPSPSAAPTPAPAPVQVPGSDGGGDEDSTPRLPSEGRSTGAGAPWSADHSASASVQAPGGATSADFISSSPAVPLPAGVTDSATVLPMPTPGHQLRDDVGMGTLRLQVTAVQLAVPLLMMLSFWGGVRCSLM